MAQPTFIGIANTTVVANARKIGLWRNALLTLALAFISMLTISSSIFAIDLPPQGVGRGGPYRAQCNGGFLVGFVGRAGAWIDNMRPICASWNGRQMLNPVTSTPQAGVSQGGGPASAQCPNFVSHIRISDTKGDGPTNVIHSVEFHCVSANGADEGWRKFGSNTRPEPRSSPAFSRGYTGLFDSVCPLGTVAGGVHGRSGSYVDPPPLLCEPPPAMRPLRPWGKRRH